MFQEWHYRDPVLRSGRVQWVLGALQHWAQNASFKALLLKESGRVIHGTIKQVHDYLHVSRHQNLQSQNWHRPWGCPELCSGLARGPIPGEGRSPAVLAMIVSGEVFCISPLLTLTSLWDIRWCEAVPFSVKDVLLVLARLGP